MDKLLKEDQETVWFFGLSFLMAELHHYCYSYILELVYKFSIFFFKVEFVAEENGVALYLCIIQHCLYVTVAAHIII